MMQEAVLIIDNRKEQALKNKRTLENANISVYLASDLTVAEMMLSEIEPDLVIICDGISEKEAIAKIREHCNSIRPVIVVLSKSSLMDFFSSSISAIVSPTISL